MINDFLTVKIKAKPISTVRWPFPPTPILFQNKAIYKKINKKYCLNHIQLEVQKTI